MNSRQRRQLERAWPHRAVIRRGGHGALDAHQCHQWLINTMPGRFRVKRYLDGLEVRFTSAQDLTWFHVARPSGSSGSHAND